MAWKFADQIHALTGFDAESTNDSETGEDFNLLANQWLVDAAKEVINAFPPELKMKCVKMKALNSSSPMDLDSAGDIFHVTRENADDGYHIGCREIHAAYAGSSSDSSSIHYSTVNDPVYWIESDTSGDPKLFVNPDPTANQHARVHYLSYPPNSTVWDGSNLPGNATSISNFPDEAEFLVPIRAAITAAEYLLAFEEDPELYGPIIKVLKMQYEEGLSSLSTKVAKAKQAEGEQR